MFKVQGFEFRVQGLGFKTLRLSGNQKKPRLRQIDKHGMNSNQYFLHDFNGHRFRIRIRGYIQDYIRKSSEPVWPPLWSLNRANMNSSSPYVG